jgi:acyl-CoA thioesterase FadM
MAKLIIEIPEKFVFQWNYDVQDSDVNAGNHLGADQIVRIAIDTQRHFVKHLGYPHSLNIDGTGLIMTSSEARYLSEARCNDRLRIDLAPMNFTDKSFELVYRFFNETQNREVARVRTTLVSFDYTLNRIIPTPPSFSARVNQL